MKSILITIQTFIIAFLIAIIISNQDILLAIETTRSIEALNKNSLYADINIYRSLNGLPKLEINNLLEESSDVKVKDMIERKYWAHYLVSKQEDLWDLFIESGYDYSHAGENLAKGFGTSEGVLKGWKESPIHNRLLLSPKYTDIGITISCQKNWLQVEEECLVVLHLAGY